jgi:hypothetical protein
MPSSHEIEIIIGADGQVRLDVKGLKGPTCLTAIKKLAESVGELKSTDLKPEYYERAALDQKNKQGK